MTSQGRRTKWTKQQRSVVIASYLGWTLDAFDYFLMTFIVTAIAAEFHRSVAEVTFALFLTLAMRPLGAFLFGRAADRWGRRPVLMIDVLIYSALELASGFAPGITTLLILRALYGVAMGGEWGVGASLTMESIPPRARGFVSGLLQSGYPTGFLLAALVYRLYPYIGWRGMFFVGVAPALLVLYIRRHVPESPSFNAATARTKGSALAVLKSHWRLAIYAVLLMTAFNYFSHGTQDLYPTFLKKQHGFSINQVSTLVIIGNLGAILGGFTCGALSERIGRRRMIVIAALLCLPVIPLWAFSSQPLWLAAGAFLMQVMVQGAWGVIPAHLNELSPEGARATFPGFVYQLGNLLAAATPTLQAVIASKHHGDYGWALAMVAGAAALLIAVLTTLGREARGTTFSISAEENPSSRPPARTAGG